MLSPLPSSNDGHAAASPLPASASFIAPLFRPNVYFSQEATPWHQVDDDNDDISTAPLSPPARRHQRVFAGVLVLTLSRPLASGQFAVDNGTTGLYRRVAEEQRRVASAPAASARAIKNRMEESSERKRRIETSASLNVAGRSAAGSSLRTPAPTPRIVFSQFSMPSGLEPGRMENSQSSEDKEMVDPAFDGDETEEIDELHHSD